MPVVFSFAYVGSLPADPQLQIVEDIRNSVAAENLRPGEFLPESRALAKQYDVERSAFENAFAALAVVGLLEAVDGRWRVLNDISAAAFAANLKYVVEQRIRMALHAATAGGFNQEEIIELVAEAVRREFEPGEGSE